MIDGIRAIPCSWRSWYCPTTRMVYGSTCVAISREAAMMRVWTGLRLEVHLGNFRVCGLR